MLKNKCSTWLSVLPTNDIFFVMSADECRDAMAIRYYIDLNDGKQYLILSKIIFSYVSTLIGVFIRVLIDTTFNQIPSLINPTEVQNMQIHTHVCTCTNKFSEKLQSRTVWKKKVAEPGKVLAFEGFFFEEHTFFVIKSEITQLFIFLCISIYYSEVVVG